MNCTNCHADITAWLNKYRKTKKVRLDEQYFKEEKLAYKYDESGPYIDGEKFYVHEIQKCFERCPKCGSKESMDGDVMDSVTWAPI